MLGCLPLETLLGAGFNLGAGLGKLRQTCLAARQLIGDRHAVRNFGRIRSLGLHHQVGHFGLQLLFDLAGMLVGQRAVPAGVGVDLRPVQCHRAHLEHAHLARQLQHPHKQLFDLLEKAPPKRRDRIVVGMLVRRDEPERHRIVGRALQPAARKPPRRISVHQDAQQQRRMVGCRTRASIAPNHRRQVQPVDHLNDEPSQMLLRKPFVNRRRKKKSSLAIYRAEIAHHCSVQP